VNPETIPGLTKINLNSNIQIGDEGLQYLTEILKDDIWIKDIEMQNCGITDEGAQSIIKCLDVNKKILNFNISGNTEISEHLYRHIVVQLGNAVQDNLESKACNEKISCSRLREENKYLQQQLETTMFQKKHAEDLNEQLHEQVLEMQKELIMQGAFQVPDGYTVILSDTLEKLMKE
jgi:centrosomal protein CEP78